MARVKVEYRTASKENYIDFCKKHIDIQLTYDEWRNIIYSFNEAFREYILETGEKIKLPFGFGEFTINKKKRKRVVVTPEGKEHINLPIDWQKTKQKGKVIYNFNYHTEGYFFGWMWYKGKATYKHSDMWYFKPSRTTSRLLNHYITADEKYQFMYNEWSFKQ